MGRPRIKGFTGLGGYPDASHKCYRWHEHPLSEEMRLVHQDGKRKGKGKGKDGGKGKGKDGGKVPIKGIVTGAACGVTQQNFASQKTPTWKISGGCGLKVRQLLNKSHGPLIAVNTLKEASQLLRIQLCILGANLEGSSWGACSNKVVSQQ